MELRHASGETASLSLRNVHAFDGDADVSGALPFGPVSDLNVIYRPDAFNASLRFSERDEQLHARAENVSILINVQRNAVEATAGGESIALHYLDALLIADTALTRAGGGVCAVIQLIEA